MTVQRYIQDDRTDEQVKTHVHLIGGKDEFLSSWGNQKPSDSYAYWACEPEDRDKCYREVKARTEFPKVLEQSEEVVDLISKAAQVHIYVVEPGHRYSAREERKA